jgi:SulP family sulfate permease
VERAPDLAALLSREGHRIHVFWLAGYVFFGSSNRVSEDIQRITGPGTAAARRWIILDLAGLSGIDTTAMLSFRKLDRWARANHVSIGLASVPAGLRSRFDGWGPAADGLSFASRQHGLSWAEQDLIRDSGIESGRDAEAAFADWLDRELGAALGSRLIETYLRRRELDIGETVCAQGEIADTIDLVADGTLAIAVNDTEGRSVTVRRTMGCTVIGEMGFVRNSDRTANVITETPTRLYTLTRGRYDAMRRADPELAAAFLEFLMRQLADRLEFATKEISALT